MSRRFGWHDGNVHANTSEVDGQSTSGSIKTGTVDSDSLNGVTMAHASTGDGSDYSAGATDDIISADTSSSTLTVTISSNAISKAGKVFVIKDVGSNAGSNAITIATEGDENIDGSTSVTISSNDSQKRLYSDGSNLFSF